MTKPTATTSHMPFVGHRTCAEWVRMSRSQPIPTNPAEPSSGYRYCDPRNPVRQPRYSHYGMEK